MKKWFLMAGILAGSCSLSALDTGGRLSFGLKGGMFSPSSRTFNREIVPAFNRSIEDFITQAAAFGFSSKSDSLDEIGLGPLFGAEVEWFFLPYLSAALGTEYFRRTPSAYSEASGQEGGTTYELRQDYRVRACIIPVLMTVRYHFPLKRWRIYAGAGAGYYSGRLDFKTDFSLKINGAPAEAETSRNEGTGRAVVPHLSAGLNFELIKRVSLAADVRYALGKINSFKIKNHTQAEMVGLEMTYIDAAGDEKPIRWELSGLSLGILIKVNF